MYGIPVDQNQFASSEWENTVINSGDRITTSLCLTSLRKKMKKCFMKHGAMASRTSAKSHLEAQHILRAIQLKNLQNQVTTAWKANRQNSRECQNTRQSASQASSTSNHYWKLEAARLRSQISKMSQRLHELEANNTQSENTGAGNSANGMAYMTHQTHPKIGR